MLTQLTYGCSLIGANPAFSDETRKGIPALPYEERLQRLGLHLRGDFLAANKIFTGAGLNLDPLNFTRQQKR